jgi:hypothetical protein
VTTRNINVTRYDDEYALFGKALPYVAMAIGAGLAFVVALITRLGIYAQQMWNDTAALDSTKMITWIIIVSAILLTALAWKLFRPRDQFHHHISIHAAVTTILIHAWMLMAMWQDIGEWMFGVPTVYAYFFGGGILGVSWCIRRWAYRGDLEEQENGSGENVFAAIGLGSGTFLDKERSYKTSNGAVYRMKLALGKTVEDAKNKAVELAQLAGKPRALVHVSETEDGVEGQVDIMILDENPFKDKNIWKGPEFPGDSIGTPISFATYDTGERGRVFIAGKDGGSSQHYLTMGMPGTGKSKVWQAIYGTVLSRKNVSVIYGDPAKGMQTGGALASGLSWFAWTEDDCMNQIDAVMRAIPARTNYLTSKGYSHWVPGCGLNFLIFHLEEAARFANVTDLVQLLEAARSAGISIVLSLQRATHDRISTSARYNLGGNLCFGVKNKSDAQFGLSEYARQSGAAPHLWQDRFPGYFYLEAAGIDQRLASHPLVADWIDEAFLKHTVDEGAAYRTPIDTVTAEALGKPYMDYRAAVESGTTQWQEMYKNQNHQVDTKDWAVQGKPDSLTDSDIEMIDLALDEPTGVVPTKPQPKGNLGTDPEDTARANAEFMTVLIDWHAKGKHTFSHKEISSTFTLRKGAWISKKLAALQQEGKLDKTPEGLWQIVSL